MPWASSTPAAIGPNAGPNVVIAPIKPIYTPILFLGATASVKFMPIGTIMPVPSACSTRAATSIAKFGAKPPTMLPANSRIRDSAIRRDVRIFLYRNPATGTITAAASMYAVVTHCTVPAFTDRSRMMGFNATLRNVSLNVARNVAYPATKRTRPDLMVEVTVVLSSRSAVVAGSLVGCCGLLSYDAIPGVARVADAFGVDAPRRGPGVSHIAAAINTFATLETRNVFAAYAAYAICGAAAYGCRRAGMCRAGRLLYRNAAQGCCRNRRECRQRGPDRVIPNPLIFLDMPANEMREPHR